MRRFTFKSLAAVCLLFAAVLTATASAKLTVGISDNRPQIFNDPNFTSLGAKHVRIVVSWNAFSAGAKGDNELSDKIVPYVQLAKAKGVEVLVAFEHSRGAPIDCRKSNKAQCKLPTVAQYKAEITKFLAVLPDVKYVTAWNESNHNTQPTEDNPKRAGQFAKAADQVCAQLGTCKVLAMDILDAANDPKAAKNKLNYSRTIKFIKKLKSGYGKSRPAICGIHNYADVNRFRLSGSQAIARAGKCKSYWLTETGGFYNFGGYWSKKGKKCTPADSGKPHAGSSKCQVAALNYLFKKTVKSIKHIDRAFIYNFYSGTDGRFDAGITKGSGTQSKSTKRPAWSVVKKHI